MNTRLISSLSDLFNFINEILSFSSGSRREENLEVKKDAASFRSMDVCFIPDLVSKLPFLFRRNMTYLTEILHYTYGLSGPKINMELFRMIGTFL